MHPTTPTNPTLADLATAQQDRHIYAHSLGEGTRLLMRLRAIHAKRMAELNDFTDFIAEVSPDIILRAVDGRERVLRLPFDEAKSICCTIREVLENQLRELEERIVEEALELARHGETAEGDLRPAILALCQPTPAAATQPSSTPTMELNAPAALPAAA